MLILLMYLLMSMLDMYALMIVLVLLIVIASKSSNILSLTVVEASGIERCHMCLDTPLSMLSILLATDATILLMTCYTDVTFVTLCIVVTVLLSSLINSQTSVCVDSVCDNDDSDADNSIIVDAYNVMIPMLSLLSLFVLCMINIFYCSVVAVLTCMRGGVSGLSRHGILFRDVHFTPAHYFFKTIPTQHWMDTLETTGVCISCQHHPQLIDSPVL